MSAHRARWIAVAIVAIYFLTLAAVHTSFGLTDDDDFYVPAGVSYVDWVGRVLTFDEGAWQSKAIDAAFTKNHEHPPVAKYVFGVCRYVFGFLGATDGARMGAVLFSTLIAALLLWLAMRHLGPSRGLMAGGLGVLLLLLLPRFHFHSHAATLDVPVAAMYLLAASAALAAERSKKAVLWCGVAFGLASATKLNAPFLVVPYLIFALLVRRGTRRSVVADGSSRSVELPSLPLALFAMAIIGPLVFLGSWPWLWTDTFKRIGEYVGFHLNHYGIFFLYFGRVFVKNPFAPWHASFTMAAITVPIATSALAVVGVAFGGRSILYRLKNTVGPDDETKREGDLLLTAILHAVVTICVVAFSGGAKYGGAKLFMPFFPFWCLLAGYGGLRLYEVARGAGRTWVAYGAVGAAVAASLATILTFGPYSLSQYNAVTGGLRGATAAGFERQYYDVAFKDLVVWLNDNAPPDAKVHFLPNNWEYIRTYRWYREANDLRKDIRVVNTESVADLIVLSHERRFARYGNDLQRYRDKPVLEERIIDGTPIWSVLRRN